ncbi:MAG: GerMN domain-containing protein [Candidatus Nanopelagicales bacterium]
MIPRRAVATRRGSGFAGVIATVALVVAGCGVPLEDSAQALPPEVIPPPIVVPTQTPTASPSPSPTPSPSVSPPPAIEVVDLYFIREDGLVPLVSDLPAPADPQVVLDALAAGPPTETGLRSVVVDPLTGTALVSQFVPSGDVSLPTADATIAVASQFSSLPSAEQVLLLGQGVLSLSSAGANTVSIVDEAGSPLAVPLPDGRLLDRPATALDYASLIRPL